MLSRLHPRACPFLPTPLWRKRILPGSFSFLPNDETRRNFHATRRQEILPLLGVATVFVVGRYSYKAWQRMDAEWEDYQWELQQYEKQMAQKDEHAMRTIAIDLGSIYAKVASSHPKPSLIVSPEGDRFFFNGIQYESTQEGIVKIRGRQAMERFYYTQADDDEPTMVQLPWNVLASSQDTSDHEIVSDVLDPALTEVLDRLEYDPNDPESTPFRSVATVPAEYLNESSTVVREALEGIAATLLPEPVAAVWGAETQSLLPELQSPDDGRTVMVVDVGGLTTQLSVVRKDRVMSSISLPWGGERILQVLVDILRKEAGPDVKDRRSMSAIHQQARTAVAELSTQTRVNVHVPYLFADPKQHHLDTTVARSVLEQAVQDDIREHVATAVAEQDVLSPHMPSPTDMTTLWISLVTQLLEHAQMTPANIDRVLLVGGACRAPLVSSSLNNALYTLMGDQSKLVQTSLAPELTVLGASTLLPNYDYSLEYGLYRMEG